VPKSITVKRALSNKSNIIAAGVLVIFLAACTSYGTEILDRGFVELVVTQFPDQRELGRYRLGSDQTFSLSFIHSVSKTRVIDVYEIRAGKIIQTKEFFKAHGAGLPSSTMEPGGISWEKTKDWFIFHMERPIPKLVVRTDKLYQNRLTLASGVIDLNQWDDQPLLLYVENGDSLQIISK
jgi:hypothetical protein